MDDESENSSNSSNRIEELIVDLGNERFMTRNDALVALKALVPHNERAISKELVRWIQLYSKSDAGDSASFVTKAAMELFQDMSEMGLEPLINDGYKNGDYSARRVAMDAIGRTGRMSVLPYLIMGMKDDDKYTRWQAAKGLGRFAGSSEARDALVEGLSDPDPHVRRRAGRSLESFGGVGPREDITEEPDEVEGPMEEDGEGDIDGDGIPDSEDEEPRKTEKEKKPKGKGKSSKEDDLARIASKRENIDFGTIGDANEDDKDDLKSIKGIGPFLEEKLNALGIYTYEQISKMTPELEDQVNEAIEFFPGRIKRDEWVNQAKDLK